MTLIFNALPMRKLPAVAVVLLGIACASKKEKSVPIATAAVQRRDIVIDAQATGVVEPINVVEVKSKAGGQIVKLPVETGSLVKPGDLLVQIETRDVQNQYDQVAAQLAAAKAKLEVSTAQKKRADELFKNRIITATENEAAQLDFANAQSQLVSARTSLDLSKQRLEDATVTAPVGGTIIEKTVSLGTVITSATGAFGGGTTLLKMADLGRVRVRALFNETDIGQVRPGQTATVTVDAYPDRRFSGVVEKIEPTAIIQQNVTMFPVLITLENTEGLLKPGMNGETSVLVEQRSNVLAVPNDAVRNPREGAATAPILGLNPDTVRAQITAQMPAQNTGRQNGGAPGGAPHRVTGMSRGDVTLAPLQQGQRKQQQSAGASGAKQGAGAPGPGLTIGAAEGASSGSRRSRAALVFVKKDATFEPRLVQLGAANFDYTEVVSGLKEGEQVALLAAAALQLQRQQQNDRIRQNSGVPGMQQTAPAGGGSRPAAGGGGRPPGG